jgi:hypothetical protein
MTVFVLAALPPSPAHGWVSSRKAGCFVWLGRHTCPHAHLLPVVCSCRSLLLKLCLQLLRRLLKAGLRASTGTVGCQFTASATQQHAEYGRLDLCMCLTMYVTDISKFAPKGRKPCPHMLLTHTSRAVPAASCSARAFCSCCSCLSVSCLAFAAFSSSCNHHHHTLLANLVQVHAHACTYMHASRY